jgi:hypothetical protein
MKASGILAQADLSVIEIGFEFCSLVSISRVMRWLNCRKNRPPLSRAAPNVYKTLKECLRDWPSIKQWPTYNKIFWNEAFLDENTDWDVEMNRFWKIVGAIKRLFVLINYFFLEPSEILLKKVYSTLDCVNTNLARTDLLRGDKRELSLNVADPTNLRNSGWKSLLSDLILILELVQNLLRARKREISQLDMILLSFPRNKDSGLIKVLGKDFQDPETFLNSKFSNFKLEARQGVWQNIDMLPIETIRIRLQLLSNINELFLKCAPFIDFSLLTPQSLGTHCKVARDVLRPHIVNELWVQQLSLTRDGKADEPTFIIDRFRALDKKNIEYSVFNELQKKFTFLSPEMFRLEVHQKA